MKFAARHAADRHRKRNRSRTRRRLLAGGGLLSVLLGAYLAVGTVPGGDFASAASAAIQRAKSLVELIQLRSPGRRTHAQLTKLKHKVAVRPHERALPKIRWAAPPILFTDQPVPLIDLVSPPVKVAGLESFTPPPLIEQPPFLPPPVFTPPTILIPPVEIPKEVPPVVPPPSPVPEPGTWASMILGLGLTGWTLRRRRKQVRSEAC